MVTAIAGAKGAGASNVRMPAAGSLRQATLYVTNMENRDIVGDSCAKGGRETNASLEPTLVRGMKGSMMRSAKRSRDRHRTIFELISGNSGTLASSGGIPRDRIAGPSGPGKSC